MKIMMIDPWGIKNTSMYTNGICMGISTYEDLTLITNYYFKKTTTAKYEIKPIFFKHSEKMKNMKVRKFIRGIEYLIAYFKILRKLKKNKYDIVHIQWLLNYKTDIFFLRIIKKYCNKLVYTAHNVIPHQNGNRYYNLLNKIYNIVDSIILHGEGIEEEFKKLFSSYDNKIIIQKHGACLNQITEYDISKIDTNIMKMINKSNKKYIFAGIMFYNKGVDRLLNIWINEFKASNDLLIIMGKKSDGYDELEMIEDKINKASNIIYLNSYVENNLFNYLLTESDLVILPYRHASMSGVIFTAAEFKKPVLCTNVGSLKEYLINDNNSFIIESDDNVLSTKLKYISESVSVKELELMGERLNDYIKTNYDWDIICKKLIKDCYNSDDL